jgi:hypothetical protein
MKTYTVYFELYGKKMKTSIEAVDKSDAMDRIRKKIIFNKVEMDIEDYDYEQAIDFLDKISGGKFKK